MISIKNNEGVSFSFVTRCSSLLGKIKALEIMHLLLLKCYIVSTSNDDEFL